MITLAACEQNPSSPESNNGPCEYEREQAIKDLEAGHIYYVINFSMGEGLPRYEKELEQILKPYNVELNVNPVSCIVPNDGDCYKEFMDSTLTAKYGNDFSDIVEQRADNLFASKRHGKIYDYWEVDERPFISKDIINNTEDPFIDYLNATLDTIYEFRYISNCIGHSHFIIEYTVDNTGKASDGEIVMEEFIRNETEETKAKLSQELLDKVNSMTIWTPGQLLDKDVSVRERRGIALTWEK